MNAQGESHRFDIVVTFLYVFTYFFFTRIHDEEGNATKLEIIESEQRCSLNSNPEIRIILHMRIRTSL